MSSPPGNPLNVTRPVTPEVTIISDSEGINVDDSAQYVEQTENEIVNVEQASSAECSNEQPDVTGMSVSQFEARTASYTSGMSEDSGVQRKRAKLEAEDPVPSVCLPSLPTTIAP